MRRPRLLRVFPLLAMLAVALPALPSMTTPEKRLVPTTTGLFGQFYPQGIVTLYVNVKPIKATGVVTFYQKGPCEHKVVTCDKPYVKLGHFSLHKGGTQFTLDVGHPRSIFSWRRDTKVPRPTKAA